MIGARVLVIYGTRPEAIKVAPVVRRLRGRSGIRVTVAVTGQHREMVAEVHRHFDIRPDADLDVLRQGQSLQALSASLYSGLLELVEREKPDAVLVHGDTSTAALAALAAYYSQVPVVHLEAGLRSGDLRSPFPEEGNRRIIGQLASLHLAPTGSARSNLVSEAVDPASIAVTGNTVIDALHETLGMPPVFADAAVADAVAAPGRLVLVTAHRREAWEGGLTRMAEGVADVLRTHPDVRVVLPLHPNPIVRRAVAPALAGIGSAVLCEPQDYLAFCHLMARAHCIVTDSGGVQEEAPSIGRPVLVTRENTERPEAIAAGAARLVGTGRAAVARELSALLDDPVRHAAMANAVSPYGDGRAAERAVAAVEAYFGLADRMPDFVPEAAPAAVAGAA